MVVVASKNKGKLKEFSRILVPMGYTVVGMEDAGFNIDITEDGDTFVDNAKLKALAIHHVTGKAVVADDSGLCIDALEGRPGVYSARYAGEETPYPEKIKLILEEMKDVPLRDRGARFECAICYVDDSSAVHIYQGTCHGYIGYEPKGTGGFGYDSIFYIEEKSFAELTDEEKDVYSHRGIALRNFADGYEEPIKE